MTSIKNRHRTNSGVPETDFSFLMHLCDMQVNRISMESAKRAQSNKTCRQSEIRYLFEKIRVKGQIVTFYCVCNALPFIIFRDL
jgi:hypothetical protein